MAQIDGIIIKRVHLLGSEILRPKVLGFALNRLWIYLLFHSALLFRPVPQISSGAFDLVYPASVTVLASALLFFGLNHKITGLNRKWIKYLGPLLAALGTLATSLTVSFSLQPILIMFCGLLTGVGSALLLLDFGRAYSLAGGRRAALDVSLSFLIAALFFPLFFVLPHVVTIAIASLLPLLSSLVLHRRDNTEQEGQDSAQNSIPAVQGKEKIKPFALIKLGIAGGIFSVATAVLSGAHTFNTSISLGGETILFFGIAIIIAPLFMCICSLLPKSTRLELIYRPSLLLVAVGFLAVPLLGISDPLPVTILIVGYTLFELMIWVILSEMSYRFSYSSIQVFGLGNALIRGVGLVAGFFLSRFLFAEKLSDEMPLLEISLLMIFALVIAYVFLFTEKDVVAYNESTLENKGEAKKVPLKQKCTIIGKQYGLSPREIEVFSLLALGRNAARVREELVISEGTANTHLRNVYQKLGVHSHQEIIDLLQHTDISDIVGPKK